MKNKSFVLGIIIISMLFYSAICNAQADAHQLILHNNIDRFNNRTEIVALFLDENKDPHQCMMKITESDFDIGLLSAMQANELVTITIMITPIDEIQGVTLSNGANAYIHQRNIIDDGIAHWIAMNPIDNPANIKSYLVRGDPVSRIIKNPLSGVRFNKRARSMFDSCGKELIKLNKVKS